MTSYSPMRSHELRRAQLLQLHGIDLAVDGGASRGDYGAELRRCGYSGRIVSIEPIPHSFQSLSQRASGDTLWACINAALSGSPGTGRFVVNDIPEVSSFLPATGEWGTEGWRGGRTIEVKLLPLADTLVDSQAAFVKLDLQGYEFHVLRGAAHVLDRVKCLELELSTVPLYEGCPLLDSALAELSSWGYSIWSIEPALVDFRSGRILQIDCLLTRAAA